MKIMTLFYYKGVAACTFLLIPSALDNTVITAALFPTTFLIITLLTTTKTITSGCVSGGQSSDFNTGGGMGSGGYDNSHCHNNEGVGEITIIIITW